MPETAPTPSLPPIDPAAVQKTFLAVLTKPAEFYPTVKAEQGFQKVLLFSVIMGVIYGALGAVASILYLHSVIAAIIAIIVGGISGLLAPFIGGAIVFVVCMLFGSKAPFESSVKVAGYASAIYPLYGLAALVGIVPLLPMLVQLVVGLYGLYICYIGAKALNFDPAGAAPPAAPPVS